MVGFDLEGPAISNLLTLPRNSEKRQFCYVFRDEKSSHTLRPSGNDRHSNLPRLLLFTKPVLETVKHDGPLRELRYHSHVFAFKGRKVCLGGE